MASEGVPDYRYRAFHKTDYQQKVAASISSVARRTTVLPTGAGSLQLEKDHRIVRQFHGPGVERNAEQPGFIYGSGASYRAPSEGTERRRGNSLYNKTSAERVKLRRQQMEAEADIQEHREPALRLQQERALEKKQDLEMLQRYYPWGKPAAGAPRVDSQGGVTATRQKFDFVQPNPTSGEGYDPFGRPGAGAPQRTDSGHVVTSVRGDPETRFQKQLKQEVEGALRYKEPNSREKHLLPWEVQLRRQEEQEEKFLRRSDSDRMRIMAEKEKQLSYARKLEQQRIEAVERRANDKTDKQVAVPVYYPWGRDQVERDDSGKVAGRRWVVGKEADLESSHNSNSKYVSLASQMGRQGGGGAPVRDGCGDMQAKRSHVGVSTAGQPGDQWGRPGAGAPLRGADGHPVTTTYGKCYREKHGTDRPLIESLEDSRKSKELETERVLKGHGMDIASWLRAGVVGQPHRNPNTGEIVGGSRSTSDITTKREDLQPTQTLSSRDYYTDLQRQAEERRQARRQQRETDKQMELEHTQKVAEAWGWGGRWTRGSRGEEDIFRREYCSELQKMMTERSEQKRRSREEDIAREKQHVELFAQQWGRPGAGAPRVNEHGQIDTTPKNFSSLLETQVYTGSNFRRA